MLTIQAIDLLVAWTPLSVAALALFLALLIAAGALGYAFRASCAAWFKARWIEKSSAQARWIAMGSTAAYVGSRLGIPDVEPVSLSIVIAGWAVAVWKFIKPDAAAVVAQTAGQGGQ